MQNNTPVRKGDPRPYDANDRIIDVYYVINDGEQSPKPIGDHHYGALSQTYPNTRWALEDATILPDKAILVHYYVIASDTVEPSTALRNAMSALRDDEHILVYYYNGVEVSGPKVRRHHAANGQANSEANSDNR